MDRRGQQIFNTMRGQGNHGQQRIMYNADGIIEGEVPGGNSIPMPKDKTVDPKKAIKLQRNVKWAMYGGGVGLLAAIVFGKGIVGFALTGAAIGLGGSVLFGKGNSPKTEADNLLAEILASSGKLTDEGIKLLKEEYTKLDAEWEKNQPAAGAEMTKIQKEALAKAVAIQKKLKESGITVNG